MRAPIDNFDARDYPKGSVSQFFGENPSLYKLYIPGLQGHNGIDIVAYKGCPLVAVEDGEIISVKSDPKGFGKHVRLLSEDREWIYAHCDEIFVKNGQKVKEGDVVATMGNTGFVVSQKIAVQWWGNAPDDEGTHCHFGLRVVKRSPGGWSYYKGGPKIEIQNYDNGFKGAIDPLPFIQLPALKRLVSLLQELVKLKK
jgi:murein DD-endopeptidase MepM/ murein hydrolase activator NlpD